MIIFHVLEFSTVTNLYIGDFSEQDIQSIHNFFGDMWERYTREDIKPNCLSRWNALSMTISSKTKPQRKKRKVQEEPLQVPEDAVLLEIPHVPFPRNPRAIFFCQDCYRMLRLLRFGADFRRSSQQFNESSLIYGPDDDLLQGLKPLSIFCYDYL